MFINPLPGIIQLCSGPLLQSWPSTTSLEAKIAAGFSSITRQREFLSGREYARQVMSACGYPFFPLYRNRDRSPAWPLGIIGSLTHNRDFTAAAVARPGFGIIGLGIDLESVNRKIEPGVLEKIMTMDEKKTWPANLFPKESLILFCAKEAAFKCLYPIQKKYLGFQDANITQITKNRFSLQIKKNPFPIPISLPFSIEGQYQIQAETLFVCLCLCKNDLGPFLKQG